MTPLTKDEYHVLHSLEAGVVAQRRDFAGAFLKAFDGLLERGLIRPVYCLTDRAHALMGQFEDGRAKQHDKG